MNKPEVDQYLAEVAQANKKADAEQRQKLERLMLKSNTTGRLRVVLELKTGNVVCLRVVDRQHQPVYTHLAIAEYVPDATKPQIDKINDPGFLFLDSAPSIDSVARALPKYLQKFYPQHQNISTINLFGSISDFKTGKVGAVVANTRQQAA